MDAKDYYQILGIQKTADQKQIKEAYRKLAFQYHPDSNPHDNSVAEKMKDINEAYAVLSHPQKRTEYDQLRSQYGSSAYGRFRNTYSEQDIFKDSDVFRMFDEMARAFGIRGVDEIFKHVYGPGYRQFEIKRPGVFAKGFFFFGAFGFPGFVDKCQGEGDES